MLFPKPQNLCLCLGVTFGRIGLNCNFRVQPQVEAQTYKNVNISPPFLQCNANARFTTPRARDDIHIWMKEFDWSGKCASMKPQLYGSGLVCF